MKKFLKSHKVNPAKIKKPDSMANSFFINLRSEEERQVGPPIPHTHTHAHHSSPPTPSQDALKTLNGCVWKKREIVAKVSHQAGTSVVHPLPTHAHTHTYALFQVAAPARDPLYQRKRKSNDSETQAKKARLAAMTPEERCVCVCVVQRGGSCCVLFSLENGVISIIG